MTTTDIRIGNVFDEMPKIKSDSIDLVLTSPPYWGLRDYGIDGQLGAEPTMEAYLDNTMRWVKEVWRVLKPNGSFVLNIGDCFLGGGWGTQISDTTVMAKVNQSLPEKNVGLLKGGKYKAKQLLSVSSFAYCRIVSETDFVCRGEHIWAKPNVPSPIRSRLKHSHEKLFWFVKDADKYYFEKGSWMKKINGQENNQKRMNGLRPLAAADALKLSPTSCFRPKERNNAFGEDQSATPGKCGCGMTNEETIEHSWRIIPCGAKQNGFELHDKPTSEHIAPFPEELIRPYIKSLCPSNGVALDPFLGSGTTMRVCLEEQRDCIGIELNEKYASYAKKRVNDGMRL